MHSDLRQNSLLNWLNQQTPFKTNRLQLISGDASNRRYFRFRFSNQSLLAVDAPPTTENIKSFSAVAAAFSEHGIRVPKINAQDLDNGFFCLEDLGDQPLQTKLNDSNMHRYYKQALSFLPGIQACMTTELGPLPAFDPALLTRDFGLFVDWFVGTHLSIALTIQEKTVLSDTFALLQDNFEQQPQVGSHRDYHSRNLMLLESDALAVIDFQDALIAPFTYDLASLLRDCYSVWPDDKIYSILQEYQQAHYADLDWQLFKRWFDLTALQRHIKICGIFSRLYHRDGKAAYLQDLPVSLSYIQSICEQYPECHDFGHFIKKRVRTRSSDVS